MVESYPNLKEEVGGSIPICEISFPLDKKLVGWSTASCVLVLVCRPSVSIEKREKNPGVLVRIGATTGDFLALDFQSTISEPMGNSTIRPT